MEDKKPLPTQKTTQQASSVDKLPDLQNDETFLQTLYKGLGSPLEWEDFKARLQSFSKEEFYNTILPAYVPKLYEKHYADKLRPEEFISRFSQKFGGRLEPFIADPVYNVEFKNSLGGKAYAFTTGMLKGIIGEKAFQKLIPEETLNKETLKAHPTAEGVGEFAGEIYAISQIAKPVGAGMEALPMIKRLEAGGKAAQLASRGLKELAVGVGYGAARGENPVEKGVEFALADLVFHGVGKAARLGGKAVENIAHNLKTRLKPAMELLESGDYILRNADGEVITTAEEFNKKILTPIQERVALEVKKGADFDKALRRVVTEMNYRFEPVEGEFAGKQFGQLSKKQLQLPRPKKNPFQVGDILEDYKTRTRFQVEQINPDGSIKGRDLNTGKYRRLKAEELNQLKPTKVGNVIIEQLAEGKTVDEVIKDFNRPLMRFLQKQRKTTISLEAQRMLKEVENMPEPFKRALKPMSRLELTIYKKAGKELVDSIPEEEIKKLYKRQYKDGSSKTYEAFKEALRQEAEDLFRLVELKQAPVSPEVRTGFKKVWDYFRPRRSVFLDLEEPVGGFSRFYKPLYDTYMAVEDRALAMAKEGTKDLKPEEMKKAIVRFQEEVLNAFYGEKIPRDLVLPKPPDDGKSLRLMYERWQGYADSLKPILEQSRKRIETLPDGEFKEGFAGLVRETVHDALGIRTPEKTVITRALEKTLGREFETDVIHKVADSLVNMYYLSLLMGKVSTGLRNLTQIALTAGEAGPVNTFKAMLDYLANGSIFRGARLSRKEITERIAQAGYGDRNMSDELGNVASKLWFNMKLSDAFNRIVSYNAGVRRFNKVFDAEKGQFADYWMKKLGLPTPLARDLANLVKKGQVEEAAHRYALEVVARTQYVYGRLNSPRITRHPLGRAAFQFQTWGMNYADWLVHVLKDFKGIKNKARAVVGLLSAQAIMGTALGTYRYGMDTLAGDREGGYGDYMARGVSDIFASTISPFGLNINPRYLAKGEFGRAFNLGIQTGPVVQLPVKLYRAIASALGLENKPEAFRELIYELLPGSNAIKKEYLPWAMQLVTIMDSPVKSSRKVRKIYEFFKSIGGFLHPPESFFEPARRAAMHKQMPTTRIPLQNKRPLPPKKGASNAHKPGQK